MKAITMNEENRLFLRRWLKHPFQLGTLAPITHRFARYASNIIPKDIEGPLVEVGAGTGRLTHYLLENYPKERLAANELDPELSGFLKNAYPGLKVFQGDARDLSDMLPQAWRGKLGAIVSVIPLMYLPKAARLEIVEACFRELNPNGRFFQVTYSARSPLNGISSILGRPISSRRIGACWFNLPPGFVWEYSWESNSGG